MIKVKRSDYRSHELFVAALAADLVAEVRQLSAQTGLSPQEVVDLMFATMYWETEKTWRERKAKTN